MRLDERSPRPLNLEKMSIIINKSIVGYASTLFFVQRRGIRSTGNRFPELVRSPTERVDRHQKMLIAYDPHAKKKQFVGSIDRFFNPVPVPVRVDEKVDSR